MPSQKHPCLCYNCFQEKPEGEGPCPYCGFDLFLFFLGLLLAVGNIAAAILNIPSSLRAFTIFRPSAQPQPVPRAYSPTRAANG